MFNLIFVQQIFFLSQSLSFKFVIMNVNLGTEANDFCSEVMNCEHDGWKEAIIIKIKQKKTFERK
jgi:hypothetical protein